MKFERLGNICYIRNGFAFKSEHFNDKGVPIIRISDINNRYVSIDKAVKINYESFFDNFKIEKGDILIAMSGATTGKYGVYISEVIAYQNQRVGCFKIKDEKTLNKEYLLQALQLLKPLIEKKAQGGAQPNISTKNIEDFEIPLPSLPTQIHIANILTKAENLIAQRKESIRLLDEYLKSTFIEMFGQSNKSLHPILKLSEVSTKITDGEHGTVNRIEKGRLYLMARNITVNNSIDLSEVSFISEEDHQKIFKRCNPEIGDLMMVCVGATIGKAVLVPPGMDDFSMARSVALIKPDRKKITPEYLLWFFNSESGKRQIKNSSNEAAQAGLYTGKLKEIFIPVPPFELQTQFAQIVEKTEALKAQYQLSLQELENLYGSLSQRAFRGQLTPKEYKLPNDYAQNSELGMAAEP